jgi:uncharacterized protein (TIGR00369 family)
MVDPWQEPVRGGHPERDALRRAGRQQLQGLLDGDVPQPPISRLTGLELKEIGAGSAVFEMPLTDWLYAPTGAIPIGPLMIPADAATACAIQTVLPAGTPFSTSELTLRLLAPARAGATLVARARLVQMKDTIGLADVSLNDASGGLIGHGSSLCMTTDLAPGETPFAPDGDGGAQSGAPDPWRRPASGAAVPAAAWERMSGLELLEAELRGEQPLPPLHHLTGLTLVSAREGQARFELPAVRWFCAPPPGRLQGGTIALLAEAALSAAILTTLPPSTGFSTIDLKVNYLRPLAADGRNAAASGTVLHRGRRTAVASSQVTDAEGRRVALATGSAILLDNHAASPGMVQA